ncbi:MAG: hypothetical protein APR54_02680 [Candidatus Cloacimonas sp. SDB]|nr:MAG: hypothetical protein APR54_02680 [Candidatus Cloacimonas sp. SDB]
MDKSSLVDNFIEKHNMTYLFLLLANLEVDRLSNLPYSVRKNFDEKITNLALRHIAANEVPDYIIDELNEISDHPVEE